MTVIGSEDEGVLPLVRRLTLGTAQFGMAYGATNIDGQVAECEALEILARAYEEGVRTIDTAAGYGSSEELLGRHLHEFPDMSVVTKSISIEGDEITVDDVNRFRAGFEHSLARLQRSHVEGFLVHRANDLLKPGSERLLEFLIEIKRDGLAGRVGVSVYDASELDRVLKVFQPDMVQVPINIFDQRLMTDGHLTRLRQSGIEIHARSVFLQGLLLAQSSTLPSYFSKFEGYFAQYEAFLARHALTKLIACLGIAFNQAHRVVVGLTRKSELIDIICALNGMPGRLPDMRALRVENPLLIDPRTWPRIS
jgi:aryl-alcohol dehydrogenase-like predicted oxidoreductase